VADADIISAFWDCTTCHSLVHELGREQRKITKALLNIATRYTSGEEDVGDAFTLVTAGAAVGGGRMAPTSVIIKSTKKGAKGGKKGKSTVHTASLQ
jgi:hypothetical protein